MKTGMRDKASVMAECWLSKLLERKEGRRTEGNVKCCTHSPIRLVATPLR